MTVTFGGVTLVDASKTKTGYQVQTKDTVLLSGRHSVQSSPQVGRTWSYSAFGTEGDVASLMGMVGYPHTLVINGTPYTKCYISGEVSVDESDNPLWVHYTVTFVQETL